MSHQDFIAFARPLIGEEEVASVVETLRSGWLTTGPKTKKFEQDFAGFVGGRHALAVNSATAGLHLALEAAGIGAGDKVVTTPYTFTATAEVIRYLGADPVFVDIEPGTFNIDPAGVREALEYARRHQGDYPGAFRGPGLRHGRRSWPWPGRMR
ncbi:MAG: aminotransferase class I/II-fold pyridoxal phosphate-dependent enzyme [Thiohalophilus sp.]|nr:aminotransferase class I/II-fold pyridoxal phosphate-dependent enzyme [Thiohalophilus sp.]MDZ7804414.1 aminotransferase class I/II-fold pyridoxal phosphate-dependent enzyme [Thiohalophilus sp.]